jgi:hypothetical protein
MCRKNPNIVPTTYGGICQVCSDQNECPDLSAALKTQYNEIKMPFSRKNRSNIDA